MAQKKDEGLNGNEKIEQAVCQLQQEPTQEQLAHTLTVIRRRMRLRWATASARVASTIQAFSPTDVAECVNASPSRGRHGPAGGGPGDRNARPIRWSAPIASAT